MGQSPAFALLDEVRRRVSIFKPLRTASRSNVYVFDSPKGNDRLVIAGDLPFMWALIAEAEPSITGYFLERCSDSETDARSLQMKVYYRDNRSELWRFINDEEIVRQRKGAAVPAKDKPQPVSDSPFVNKGIVALRRKSKRIDNILLLCSMFNRARGSNVWYEARHLDETLYEKGESTLAELLRIDGIDPARMLAVIALRVLGGSVTTDLDSRLFGRTSVIRRDEGAISSPLTPVAAVLSGIGKQQAEALEEEDDPTAHAGSLLNRGRPRKGVPPAHRNYRQWVQVDEVALMRTHDDIIATRFINRRKAVQMYLDNRDFATIEKRSGIPPGMVLYWVKRCLLPDGAGGIVGFPALLDGFRAGYTRTKPQLGTPGSGTAGYAGEFGRLLSTHPGLAERIENLLFGEDAESVPETQMPYTAIHEIFKKELKAAGLTKDDYPFITDDAGFKSVYLFCKELELQNPLRSRIAREGSDAGNRGDGRGPSRRIKARRPLSIVQLDFHYTDAIGVLVDEDGVEHELPVARFYIGLLIDEDTGSILGFHYLLQLQPNTDSVLDVVDSALYPREFTADDPHLKFTPDGRFLMNSFIPELSRHGYSMLRMDRGWSNIAKDVTNNLMNVLGCALQFGPSGAWWVRPLIERAFKTLTRRGLQRMPSTLGSNTQDIRKDQPDEQAVRYRVMVSDLLAVMASEIHRFNTEGRAGAHEASPLDVMRAALVHPESPYMPQPLPADDKKPDWMLFAHVETIRISRDRRGARPCARVSAIDCLYRNSYLAESDWLVSKRLLVYINRRDIRQAVGVLEDSGTYVGELIAEGRFEDRRLTWTEAVAYKRDRKIRSRHSDLVSAATQLRVEKIEEAAQAAKSKPKRRKAAKRAALEVAKQQLDHKDDPPPAPPQGAWQEADDAPTAFGFRLRVISGKGRD